MELYHLELTTDERNELLMALGYWHGAMLKAGRPWFEHKLDVVNKIAACQPSLRPAGSPSTSSGSEREATAAGSSPVATQPAAVSSPDIQRGTRPPLEGRAGGDKPLDPRGSRPADSVHVITLSITPESITKIGSGEKERLLVRFPVTTRSGNPPFITTENKTASCWASCKDIWPAVLDTVKRPTVFLIKESKGYINIVGVKDL